ncbi:hypothetical protein IGJ55_000737 [Enterococcus sp. AZ170]|uniref:phage baseplate protein n=1 Tax=Enterococcus sp. AZ170 TaxID=2774747 RepID=UPI003D2F9C42
MADIVQLEEKGNLLYPKTHVSAIDNFDETVVKKTGDEEITGVKNFKNSIQINGKNLLDIFYPIGSIFQSTDASNPSTIMGGSWERIKGRVLIGVDEADTDFTSGKIGGEKTHQLAIWNIPNRVIKWTSWKGGNISYSPWQSGNVEKGKFIATDPYDAGDESSRPISNLQPYMTVYIWKRIN